MIIQTLGNVFAANYLPSRLAFARRTTIGHYECMLRQFNAHLGYPASLADLNDAAVGGYLRRLMDRGLSPYSVDQRRQYLLALWRWCHRKRLVEAWPDVPRIQRPELVPDSWSITEVRRLLAACRLWPGPNVRADVPREWCGIKARDWLYAIHLFLFQSGERLGATLALRWQWCDLEAGRIAIPGRVRKDKQAQEYYVGSDCVAAFRAIAEPERELVFPLPATIHSFYHHYRYLLRTAGLPVGRKNGPQKMRRTFATFLEAAGGDATAALKHSARRVTVQSYLDKSALPRPKIAELLPKLAE